MIRMLDILLSVLMFMVLSPVFLVIVMFYSFEGGSVIFRQRRLGKDQVCFTIYKFRTMPINTPQLPTHQLKNVNVSTFGKFLRATKLDELPQLVNVLKGDMSLVGPRPCLESQVDLIRLRSDSKLFSLRPGITGAAQIQKVDMEDPEKLIAIERAMLEKMTFSFYLKNLFLTPLALICKKN